MCDKIPAMKRRDFLQLTAFGAVAIALPVRGSDVLYGDGVHDDTLALQAFLDGKPVIGADGQPIKDIVRSMVFKLSDTIYFRGSSKNQIIACVLCFSCWDKTVIEGKADRMSYSQIKSPETRKPDRTKNISTPIQPIRCRGSTK